MPDAPLGHRSLAALTGPGRQLVHGSKASFRTGWTSRAGASCLDDVADWRSPETIDRFETYREEVKARRGAARPGQARRGLVGRRRGKDSMAR